MGPTIENAAAKSSKRASLLADEINFRPSRADRCPRRSLTLGVAVLALCALFPASARAAKTPQVEANHMRWEDHDAVLTSAVAWQEERRGHWVTVVVLTDRPLPREALAPDKHASELMEEGKAQGIAFAVESGGVPTPEPAFDIAYHDGDAVTTSTLTGAGGFEIDSQSADRIKGRAVFNVFTAGSRDSSAWSVSFDARVLRGDAARMAAEGEPLGAGGGQPGKDLLAAQKAMLAMDAAALSAYATPELAAELKDPAKREKTLAMLKSMTPPSARVLGGLRTGDSARVYWLQQWPAGLDNRCVDTLVLKDGTWRSTETACQSE